MKSYALFQQYIWLVNTIRRAGKITLDEINERWVETEMSGGLTMVRSTFNRHRDAICDMFGIVIECDRRDGFRYYIYNPEVLKEDTIQNWVLSSMSVNSILGESLGMHERILLEPIPSSEEHLDAIIEAMKRSVRISVRYRRYGSDKESDMTLDPLCVKLFNRRWYVLVKFPDGKDSFCLALDRITSLEVTDIKFTYDKEFDPALHFRERYGIFNDPEVPVEKVVIRAFGKEVYYLRDLPLHHSQREAVTGEEYSDFEYRLRPTPDFLSPILARGSALKVLEPQHVADAVRDLHRAALMQYEEQ